MARVYEYRTISETVWTNNYKTSFDLTTNNFFDGSNNKLPVVLSGGDATPISGKYYWVQMGGDIDGEAAGDNSGFSVSLNTDGTILAISAIYNDGTTGTSGNNRGHVRVYQYRTVSQNEWNVLDNSVNQIYNNSNKNPILITGGDRTWNATKKYWVQRGGDIDGEAAADQSGWSVSLSADGSILAIGATGNDGTSGTSADDRGHTRVYQYRTVSQNEWNVLDNSVNLLYNNTNTKPILITGGDTTWNSTKKYWVQMIGGDIDGEFGGNGVTIYGDQSGLPVSLSDDGRTIAIAATYNDGTTTNFADNRGSVRVYQYSPARASTLYQQGVQIQTLQLANYVDSEIASAGYSSSTLKTVGGYTASQLYAFGFTAQQLKDAGFSTAEVFALGYSITDIMSAGFLHKRSLVLVIMCLI
jgi:hypothetical protein